jgi:hypothetical protein
MIDNKDVPRQQPFEAEDENPRDNQVASSQFQFGLGRKKSGV